MSAVFKERYIRRNAKNLYLSFNVRDYKRDLRAAPYKIHILALLMLRKILYHANALKTRLFSREFFTKAYGKQFRANPMRLYLLFPIIARRLIRSFAYFALEGGILEFYIRARMLVGKVDLPYFELVLTTRCTMRCEACNNLMQYFTPQNAYMCSLEGITAALDRLLEVVDSVGYVRIIGGEPLLFKDIASIVEYIDKSPKVRCFDIVTNGTIIPKPALLSALARSHKAFVSISDYTNSPNLKIPLHYKKITALLKSYHINHSMLWNDENARWFDPGAIYKRGREKSAIIENFRACLMPCVSVMSSEGIMKNRVLKNSAEGKNSIRGGGALHNSTQDNCARKLDSTNTAHIARNFTRENPTHSEDSTHIAQNNAHKTQDCATDSVEDSIADSMADSMTDSVRCGDLAQSAPSATSGQIFICPIASSLSRLLGLEAFSGDFVRIDSALTKEKILAFYKQDFFKACDYCRDMSKKPRLIPIATQADSTLRLAPRNEANAQ